MAIKHIDDCFVCGKSNSQGLKVNFILREGDILGEFTAGQNHQGPRGTLHGGVVSALLDEAMATLINQTFGTHAATASLEIRFRRPVRINEKLIIKASLFGEDRRVRYAQASIEKEDGTVVATGKGKFLNKYKLE